MNKGLPFGRILNEIRECTCKSLRPFSRNFFEKCPLAHFVLKNVTFKKSCNSCHFVIVNLTELSFFLTNKEDKREKMGNIVILWWKKSDMTYNSDISCKLDCEIWYEIKFSPLISLIPWQFNRSPKSLSFILQHVSLTNFPKKLTMIRGEPTIILYWEILKNIFLAH